MGGNDSAQTDAYHPLKVFFQENLVKDKVKLSPEALAFPWPHGVRILEDFPARQNAAVCHSQCPFLSLSSYV